MGQCLSNAHFAEGPQHFAPVNQNIPPPHLPETVALLAHSITIHQLNPPIGIGLISVEYCI